MPVLSGSDRLRAANQIMRDARFRQLIEGNLSALGKAALRAAVNGADDWIETPATRTAYNLALPQPFRGAATDDQKMVLLAAVLLRKAGGLPAEEDR